MDLDSIKAGKYVLVTPFWDEYLSKPGEPFDFKRHRRGDTVDLNVADAMRLVSAGAVVSEKDYAEHQAAVEAANQPPVLDPSGFAVLRETLGLGADADQAAILAALEDLATKPADDEKPAQTAGIDKILKYVGDDKDRAAEFLSGELARQDKDPRAPLVDKLKAVVDAGSQGGGGS